MIVVHIGLRKAGSTSIQNFLKVNETALGALSVDYPRVGRQARNNHTNLAREIRGLSEFDPDEGTVEELANVWRRESAATMVLSAEALEECEPEQALRLAALRRGADEEVRVVLIIRDLIDLMPSSYAQMVKLGVKIHAFDDFFKKRLRDRRVDYFATAQRWADAFGWESLKVRLLDRRFLVNGDLIDDFLSVVGLDPNAAGPRGLKRPGAANISPGWKVIEAVRALNADRHGLPDGHPLLTAGERTRAQGEQLGRRAIAVGEKMGWNADRGLYLTRKQARRSLEINQRAVEALNQRLASPLPMPKTLVQRNFTPRETAPDVSQIAPTDLRDFYDALTAAV